MAKLIWHQEGENKYEFGVDRGVYYSHVGNDLYDYGVVWNGLVDVEESSDGGAISSYHFDGIKYLDIVEPRTYQAKITSYAPPQQFSKSLGDKPLVPGFILTRQSRDRFGLSYRTFVGPGDEYKIHLVYNILATPVDKGSVTTKGSGSAETFSWKIDAVPPAGFRFRPSAHFILDSGTMNPDALEALELIIYGMEDTTARLPGIGELIGLISLWNPLLVGPQTIPGLAELVPGVGDLTQTLHPAFYAALPQTRLGPSPIDGLYRLEA